MVEEQTSGTQITKGRRGRPPKSPFTPRTLPSAARAEFRALALSAYKYGPREITDIFRDRGFVMSQDCVRKAIASLRRNVGLPPRAIGRPANRSAAESPQRAGAEFTVTIQCHDADTFAKIAAALASAVGAEGGAS